MKKKNLCMYGLRFRWKRQIIHAEFFVIYLSYRKGRISYNEERKKNIGN